MYTQRIRFFPCNYDITKNCFYKCHGKNIIFNVIKTKPLNTYPEITAKQMMYITGVVISRIWVYNNNW